MVVNWNEIIEVTERMIFRTKEHILWIERQPYFPLKDKFLVENNLELSYLEGRMREYLEHQKKVSAMKAEDVIVGIEVAYMHHGRYVRAKVKSKPFNIDGIYRCHVSTMDQPIAIDLLTILPK